MSASLTSSAVAAGNEQGYELNITRTFDAPRELVWKAWTDPQMVMEWKGPRGFKVTEYVNSEKPGGMWRLTMEGQKPGSSETVKLRQHGVMKEIRPPELLVFTFAWDDRSCVGLPESPFKENTVTIRLEERGEKTVMHFTQGPFASESERDGHGGGWNSSFDRFAEFMLAEQPGRKPAADDVPSELHLKRIFAAPRELVFKAFTDAEMLKQWFAPKCFTVPHCVFEARGGGKIEIDMQGPDGKIYASRGKVVEMYPPYRFHTLSGVIGEDGKPMFEVWQSMFFEEVEGGTRLVLDMHVTERTPMAEFALKGMTEGWNQTLDKLAALLARQ